MSELLPTVVHAHAPGRVNLIGEHTDYNGGYVLPMGIDLATYVDLKVLPRSYEVRARSANFEKSTVGYMLGEETATHEWSDYLKGTTALLRKHNFKIGGAEISIRSDLPLGGGLSSSASFEVCLLRAFREAFHLELSDLEIAKLSQKVENDFVGAKVGIMDPMAVSLCQKGCALFINTRTLACEHLPIPTNRFVVLVINSGISHRLSATADGPVEGYNLRRHECEEAAKILKVTFLSEVKNVADVDSCGALSDLLKRRARHIVTENARVIEAKDALKNNDAETLGKLFNESHRSMREDFAVSIPEIDTLVSIAQSKKEIFGARLTGGGFGGSIVALSRPGQATLLGQKIAQEYEREVGVKATLLLPRL